MPATEPQNPAMTNVSQRTSQTLCPSIDMRRGWSRVPIRLAPNGERENRQMKNSAIANTISVK